MNKLLLLAILACFVLLASSFPATDNQVVNRERRSPCGSGGCSLHKSIQFGRKQPSFRFGGRRNGRKNNFFSRFSNKRFEIPDDDFQDLDQQYDWDNAEEIN